MQDFRYRQLLSSRLGVRLTLALAGAALVAGSVLGQASPASAQLNENAGKLALADIQATFVGADASGSPLWMYRFKVKNTSGKTASNVKIVGTYNLRDLNGGPANPNQAINTTVTMAPGEERTIDIWCPPPAGKACVGAVLRATYTLDPNHNNDVAAFFP